jgi:hypothetical protein
VSTDDQETANLALKDQFIATLRSRSWREFHEWLAGTLAMNVADALDMDPENPPDSVMSACIVNADYALRLWVACDGDANAPLLD